MKFLLASFLLSSNLLMADVDSMSLDDMQSAVAGDEATPTLFLDKALSNSTSNSMLPKQTLKLRLKGNIKKVEALKKLLSSLGNLYEIGQVTDVDIILWHELLYSTKHNILLDKYRISSKIFNAQTNIQYLSEKLDIHLEELKFIDKKILHIKALYDAQLIDTLTYEILNVKVINTFSSYEVTLSLYNSQSTKKKKSYENLITKVDKLFYGKI